MKVLAIDDQPEALKQIQKAVAMDFLFAASGAGKNSRWEALRYSPFYQPQRGVEEAGTRAV